VEKKTTSIEVEAFVSDMKSINVQISVEELPSEISRKIRKALEELNGARLVAAVKELSLMVTEAGKALTRFTSVLRETSSRAK
jgi:predicted RNA binding protein with dsRBD fold (UPF0201 family)